jgi:DNA-binding GntR family transcriptional regulator
LHPVKLALDSGPIRGIQNSEFGVLDAANRASNQPRRAGLLAILDEIFQGALAPGTHLVQDQLAERLGVSRQPIQQAMALLKSDGLVQELGARGLYVAPLDVEAMRQHYEIRAALDVLAARLGAGRARGSSEIADEIARRGQMIMTAGTAAVAAGDIRLLVHYDVAFHKFLYEVSGNPLLTGTAEPHWRYLRRVMAEVLRHAQPGPQTWEQHRGILNAIVSGDAEAAMECAARHVSGAAEELSRAFRDGRVDGGSPTAGNGAGRMRGFERIEGARTL